MKRPKPHSITSNPYPVGKEERAVCVETVLHKFPELKPGARIRFTRSDSFYFDVRMLDNGMLEVRSSRSLIVAPHVSNDIMLDCAPGMEPPRGEWLTKKKKGGK